MNLYEAIYKRKSVRKYSEGKLSREKLNEIREGCDSAERLYKDIDFTIHLVEEGENIQKIMLGIIGNYGKVLAPHYLVITSEAKEGYLENVGYVLEQVVLELTAMGVATCWLGGHIKEESLRGILEVPSNHKPVVMVSFGYAKDGIEFLRKDPKEAKRKNLNEIVDGNLNETWKEIMEAVRIAPSAANSQPWKFDVDDKKIHVYCEGPKNFLMKKFLGTINKLDIGIGLAHVKIAAEHLNKEVKFDKSIKAENKEMNYMTTIEELKKLS